MIFRNALKAMVKKEITSDHNWKEAFWEPAFRCVNATHRVTRLSSVFSLLTQFSGNLQWDTCERNEACGDKRNILRWKLDRSFVRNFVVMCEFISKVTLMFHEAVHYRCFWGTWEGLLWIALRPAVIKEISSVQIVNEAFWDTSFCSLNSSPWVTA